MLVAVLLERALRPLLEFHAQPCSLPAAGMKRNKAVLVAALNRRTLALLAYITNLVIKNTSFHLLLGISSIPSIGSIKTELAIRHSGIHIAQTKCAHLFVEVCL
jgi:hypothetical protein